MANVFIAIYHFLIASRLRTVLVMLVILIPLIFMATQLRFEEDVTKLMPDDQNVHQLNEVLQSSRFADQLVFNLTASGTETTTDDLEAYAEALAFKLHSLQPELIATVKDKVTNDSLAAVFQTIYIHLPLYLDEEDYTRLEGMMNDSSLQRIINRNYKTLISPASAVLKGNVLKDPLGMIPMGLQKLESLQLNEAFKLGSKGHILTHDGKHLLLFAATTNPSNETGRNTVLIDSLDLYIQQLNSSYAGKVTANYFGPAAIAVANATRMKADIQLTMSVATVLLILLILWYYRKPQIFLLIFLPVAFGGVFALAMMYLIKTTVSSVALGVGSILLGITLDYSLHTVTHYKHAASTKDLLRDIAVPILICAITTVGTLLGLLFVKSEALQEMGMFSAFSVLGAALFSITFLPVLVHWGLGKASVQNDGQVHMLERLLGKPFHKSRVFNWGVILLFVVSWFFASGVQFENDMSSINYMPKHLKEAENQLDSINNYKLKHVYLVSSAQTIDQALQLNEQTEQRVRKLQAEGLVQQYTNVSSLLMSEKKQAEKIARWNEFWTPERRQYVADKVQEYSVALGFKPDAYQPFFDAINQTYRPADAAQFKAIQDLVLEDFINTKPNAASVVTLLRVDGRDKEAVYAALEGTDHVTLFDKQYVTNKLVALIKGDFDLLVYISFFVVFFILIVSYRDILLALVVMLPVIISWYFMLGIMSVFDLKFNIINIVISTFLYGVGIDYSVFVIRGLLTEYRTGANHLATYKTSVFLSACTTVIGAAALTFATHPALRSIAFSMMGGSLSVVILSYTIVPAAFYWMVRDSKGHPRKYPVTFKVFPHTFFFYLMVVAGAFIAPLLGVFIFALAFIPIKYRKLAFHYLLYLWGRFYIAYAYFGRFKFINPHDETFEKPAIITSNHLSLLDTPMLLRLKPKMIILTTDWVRNSPLFGMVTRMGDMYSVTTGVEEVLPKLREMVEQGYSIAVFPEGHRSHSTLVGRFHKGAWYLSNELGLDILPVIIQGTRYTLGKGDILGKWNTAAMKVLERIPPGDTRFGTTARDCAKNFKQYYLDEQQTFYNEVEDKRYRKQQLQDLYIFKGIDLNRKLRHALKVNEYYSYLDSAAPATGDIAVLGAGYGFSCFALSFQQLGRKVLAVEPDNDKRGIIQQAINHKVQVEVVDTAGWQLLNGLSAVVLEDLTGFDEAALAGLADKLTEDGTVVLFGAIEQVRALRKQIEELLGEGWASQSSEPLLDYLVVQFKRRK